MAGWKIHHLVRWPEGIIQIIVLLAYHACIPIKYPHKMVGLKRRKKTLSLLLRSHEITPLSALWGFHVILLVSLLYYSDLFWGFSLWLLVIPSSNLANPQLGKSPNCHGARPARPALPKPRRSSHSTSTPLARAPKPRRPAAAFSRGRRHMAPLRGQFSLEVEWLAWVYTV